MLYLCARPKSIEQTIGNQPYTQPHTIQATTMITTCKGHLKHAYYFAARYRVEQLKRRGKGEQI